MASTHTDSGSDNQRGKGYTAPKGRPTTHNYGDVKRSRLSPRMEWVLAFIAFVAVLAGIFYFGAGWGRGGGGGGGPHGAPAPDAIVEVVDIAV